jgi:hypothetical protein
MFRSMLHCGHVTTGTRAARIVRPGSGIIRRMEGKP